MTVCPSYNTDHVAKFAVDDCGGPHHNKDEANYKSQVSQSVQRRRDNNLFFNVGKTKKIINFRGKLLLHPPLTINGAAVERVNSTKFLGVHVSGGTLLDNKRNTAGQESSETPVLLLQTEESTWPTSLHVLLLQGHY